LSRALGIPARAVSAYALGLNPPDFHAVFEVYLEGNWWLIDPTRLAPVEGIVRIGSGRDASDIAFLTSDKQCQVLRQTIKLRSYDFASHGVEVVEEFDENLAHAVGDGQQLQQVFLNILNNAYDAVQDVGQRGRIAIRTSEQGSNIEVAVTDNGTGVTDTERIFDPFYTTKQAAKGTGLGLSICYGIVRAHGGEILCRNNENAPGSTFFVRVPVANEAATTAIAKEAGR